jgi:hypothetical protein
VLLIVGFGLLEFTTPPLLLEEALVNYATDGVITEYRSERFDAVVILTLSTESFLSILDIGLCIGPLKLRRSLHCYH